MITLLILKHPYHDLVTEPPSKFWAAHFNSRLPVCPVQEGQAVVHRVAVQTEGCSAAYKGAHTWAVRNPYTLVRTAEAVVHRRGPGVVDKPAAVKESADMTAGAADKPAAVKGLVDKPVAATVTVDKLVAVRATARQAHKRAAEVYSPGIDIPAKPPAPATLQGTRSARSDPPCNTVSNRYQTGQCEYPVWSLKSAFVYWRWQSATICR